MAEAHIWGVFHEPQRAAAIAERWPDAHFFSAEPPEALAGIHSPEKTPLGKAAVAGGLIGALIGLGLVLYAWWRMRLEVGGMERTPLGAIGIIMFAITALEAITGVMVVLLVKGRLLGLRGSPLAVPENIRRHVAQGAVATMVRAAPAERESIERELTEAGAEVLVIEVK